MAATHDNAGIAAWNFKLKAEIHSYEDCAEFLAGAIERDLGPKMTVLRQPGDVLAVRLYNTEIIRYYPDGTFSVDNGGYNTPTTSERLNAVLPEGFSAYHRKKLLGLYGNGYTENGVNILWPLDHSVRIRPTKGE